MEALDSNTVTNSSGLSPSLRSKVPKAQVLRSLEYARALNLALLLASCSTTPHTVPLSTEDLAGFVLIIKETPDGQVSHIWQPAIDFDLSKYNQPSGFHHEPQSIILASNRSRDCDQEQIDCYRGCMKRRLPAHLNHIKRGSGAHGAHCANICLKAYMECLELQNSRALEFPIISDAVEWLKRHRQEFLVGSIVVIAGVAFVTLSAGAGLIILAPVALVASSDSIEEQWIAGAPT